MAGFDELKQRHKTGVEMDENEIANLVYSYAEHIDSGNFEAAAALFSNARIKIASDRELLTHEELLALWQNTIILYPDGTPKTKHLISNPIINIDRENATATCRTYYTVMQGTDTLRLQAIASGRYHDEFVQIEGQWRFSFRDYSLHDSFGDMSHHSRNHARSSQVPNHQQATGFRGPEFDTSPTKAKILAAAQEAFSTHGYTESGTRRIAEMAGLSAGLVNRHFGSKAALFETALSTALDNPVFPESRETFGRFIAERLETPGHYLSPHSMTLLAVGNEEARDIVTRVLEAKGITPLAEWLGSPDADSRAREILALCAGFVLYNSQLTRTAGDSHMVEWLAKVLQDIVDQSH